MNYELKIEGMMCQMCQKHVTEALEKIDGVSGAAVNLEKGSASVTAEKSISRESFAAAVADAGYKLTDYSEA